MMKLNQITHWLNKPETSVVNLQQRRFWLQCQRDYTFQPIYRTDGTLLAVELLTVVHHPDAPTTRIPPDRYFAAISTPHQVEVVGEQLRLLQTYSAFFEANGVLASVNVDGPTLIAMKQSQRILHLVATLPWVRFEIVEHVNLPYSGALTHLKEFGPLWLDDFGTGVANFSALSETHYEYIKIARDLFIMLRKTEEGRTLFGNLLRLMNRYCKGVIVEGVETLDEWRDVQASAACAAQGYFLARPTAFERLNELKIFQP